MDTSNIVSGEIIGTLLLVLIGCGTNAANSLKGSFAKNSGWTFVTLGWGAGIMVAVFAALPLSGAHLNPAVSLAQLILGNIDSTEFIYYVCGQLIGAFIGAALVAILYYDHFQNTEDENTVLGTFATAPAYENTPINILGELVATFVLIFTLLVAGEYKEWAVVYVPFIVFAVVTAFGSLSGFALNPARDLMPRLLHQLFPFKNKRDSNWKYVIVPIVGPLLGGAAAALLFSVLY